MKYFSLTRERGLAWNSSIPMREQNGWREHAAFMDGLAEEGFIVFGGPVGRGDKKFMFLVKAENEREIKTRLAADPWTKMRLLKIAKIEPWEILLGKKD